MPELQVDEQFVWYVEAPQEEYGEFRPSVDGAMASLTRLARLRLRMLGASMSRILS